jgi:hypothetical protein
MALALSRRGALFSDLEQLSGHGRSAGNRYGAKYYATNRLTLPAAEVRRLYRFRAQIEEVIRVCRDQLGLTGCQARSERASCITSLAAWSPFVCWSANNIRVALVLQW